MATIEQAREVLRGLTKAVVISEGSTFTFTVGPRTQTYAISSDSIDQYLSKRSEISRIAETQLSMPGYYEHVVQFENPTLRRPDSSLTLESADGKTKIEIGEPSLLFCLSLTDTQALNRDLQRRLHGPPISRPGAKSITDYFRFRTIKISTSPDTALGRAPSRLHELAEAAAFHFAYGNGISISFAKSWARTYYWIGRKSTEQVQFPLRTYNSELIGYHSLALGTDSMFLSYLALYKILEYFYTSASESVLHQKVKAHIINPDFSHTKAKKIRDLIKIIRQFDTRLDELSALKLVLAEHFDKTELRQWIEEHETNNSPHFTEERTILNRSMRIDTSDNTIIPNIATRIYTIRNALVHNKEGEVARFVPYSGQEEVLQKEVQILLFLAEQLIIKTGKDITH